MKFSKQSGTKKSGKKSTKELDRTSKKVKKSKSSAPLDDGDEVVEVTPDDANPTQSVKVVELVRAFEGGIVHESLRNAVNAHWRRSAESDIFMKLLVDDLSVNGMYIGSIYVKSSFCKKQGGQFFI